MCVTDYDTMPVDQGAVATSLPEDDTFVSDPQEAAQRRLRSFTDPFNRRRLSSLKNKQYKQYKDDVVGFCRWITPILASHLLWERSQPPARTPPPKKENFSHSSSSSSKSVVPASGSDYQVG